MILRVFFLVQLEDCWHVFLVSPLSCLVLVDFRVHVWWTMLTGWYESLDSKPNDRFSELVGDLTCFLGKFCENPYWVDGKTWYNITYEHPGSHWIKDLRHLALEESEMRTLQHFGKIIPLTFAVLKKRSNFVKQGSLGFQVHTCTFMVISHLTWDEMLRSVAPRIPDHPLKKIQTHLTGSSQICSFGRLSHPKNHGISKLVVWRSQKPAIQIQTPLFRRVQWFLGHCPQIET